MEEIAQIFTDSLEFWTVEIDTGLGFSFTPLYFLFALMLAPFACWIISKVLGGD